MPEYQIGEASRLSGVSVRTIRYYERIGLIPAAPRHDSMAHTGGNRIFLESDISRLRFIQRARSLELSLEEIKSLLEFLKGGRCPSREAEYHQILEARLSDIDRRISQLQELRRNITGLAIEPSPNDSGTCEITTCRCVGSEPKSATPAISPKPEPSTCACARCRATR